MRNPNLDWLSAHLRLLRACRASQPCQTRFRFPPGCAAVALDLLFCRAPVDLAVELSLQPWRAFGVDGVIMFSDILTPLPGMGIDFDILPGKGPIIPNAIRSLADVKERVHPMADPASSHPFIGEILGSLRKETEGKCTLLGFVGAPWTLAAYSIEGGSTKNCEHAKRMMYESPETLDALLETITDSIIEYASYQIRSGAQIMQLFDSWGQHLSPAQFVRFAKPFAERVTVELQARHPGTPVVYFAHGSSGYLELQKDMAADMLSLDWRCDMRTARATLGADVKVAGNVDPLILFAPQPAIRAAVRACIDEAGGQGHVLNLGSRACNPRSTRSLRAAPCRMLRHQVVRCPHFVFMSASARLCCQRRPWHLARHTRGERCGLCRRGQGLCRRCRVNSWLSSRGQRFDG